MRKSKRLYGFMILFFLLVASMPAIQGVSASSPLVSGVNYTSTYWHYEPYYTSDSVLNRDFQLFQENGLTIICINIQWSYLEPSMGSYRQSYLDDIIRVCNIAEQYGIEVIVDFHTLMFDDSFTVPSWVYPRRFATVFSDSVVRQAWLDVLAFSIQSFAMADNIHSVQLMNEPWLSGQGESADDFIGLFEEMSQTARMNGDMPVSIRFTSKEFDTTFHRDQRIYDCLDYISLTWYEQYDTYEHLQANVEHVKLNGKQVWIAEYGFKTNRDSAQVDAYRDYLDFFTSIEIDGCLAWHWRADSKVSNPDTVGKGYIIAKNIDGIPRAAFYEVAAYNNPGVPDTEPPVISSVVFSEVSSSSATITWSTDEASNSVVSYGTDTPPVNIVSDSMMVTSHSVALSGLVESTTYYFEVSSTDASGNMGLENNGGAYFQFTTQIPDTTSPEITAPTGDALGTTGEYVTVSATITDNVAVASAEVHYTPIEGTENVIAMSKEESSDVWAADVPVSVDKVGTLTYYMVAYDLEENVARNPAEGLYTITVSDNDVPVAEAGADQALLIGETAAFDGSESTDNVGIISYSWDFDASDGIGEDATGIIASQVYDVEGIFVVTLTVTDEAGNSKVDTLLVSVTEFPVLPTADLAIEVSRTDKNRGVVVYSLASATVTVLVDGNPLVGATVTGVWSGAFDDVGTGVVGDKGEVTFRTSWVKQAGPFTFTVTSVELNDVSYSLAGEISDTI